MRWKLCLVDKYIIVSILKIRPGKMKIIYSINHFGFAFFSIFIPDIYVFFYIIVVRGMINKLRLEVHVYDKIHVQVSKILHLFKQYVVYNLCKCCLSWLKTCSFYSFILWKCWSIINLFWKYKCSTCYSCLTAFVPWQIFINLFIFVFLYGCVVLFSSKVISILCN